MMNKNFKLKFKKIDINFFIKKANKSSKSNHLKKSKNFTLNKTNKKLYNDSYFEKMLNSKYIKTTHVNKKFKVVSANRISKNIISFKNSIKKLEYKSNFNKKEKEDKIDDFLKKIENNYKKVKYEENNEILKKFIIVSKNYNYNKPKPIIYQNKNNFQDLKIRYSKFIKKKKFIQNFFDEIINWANFMNSIKNFSFNELFFPNKPFQMHNSKKLFKYLKFNNKLKFESGIYNNKYFVYQYDYFKRNLLHWCCIRDLKDYIPILLFFKIRINIKDYFGYYPIDYAIKNKNYEIISILLENNCYISHINVKYLRNYINIKEIMLIVKKIFVIKIIKLFLKCKNNNLNIKSYILN